MNGALSWIRVGDDMTDTFLTVAYTHTQYAVLTGYLYKTYIPSL